MRATRARVWRYCLNVHVLTPPAPVWGRVHCEWTHAATFHTWTEIPIDLENTRNLEKKTTAEGYKAMFLKCAALRWLLIDEISTAGLKILGLLAREACEKRVAANYTPRATTVTSVVGAALISFFAGIGGNYGRSCRKVSVGIPF